VVAPLTGPLKYHSGFFQKIWREKKRERERVEGERGMFVFVTDQEEDFRNVYITYQLTDVNIRWGQFARRPKVDPDELALWGKYILNAAEIKQQMSKLIVMHAHSVQERLFFFFLVLTKRDELSFLSVLALPNASMAGFASMIWSSRVPWVSKMSHYYSMFTFYFKSLLNTM